MGQGPAQVAQGSGEQDLPGQQGRPLKALVLFVAVGCGGGPEREPERAPLAPAPPPVRIELAWVVTAAPTEVEQVECKLVLRVIDHEGKDRIHEVGSWWRAQKAAIELVVPDSATGPIFFRTGADMGQDGELTDRPSFEVARGPGGAVIVRGRDGDTPWRDLVSVPFPSRTDVQARTP